MRSLLSKTHLFPLLSPSSSCSEGFGRYLADRLGDHPSFAIPLTDDDLPSDDAFFSPDSSSPFSLDNPSYSSYFAPTAYTTASLDKTPHDQSISHNMFRLSADVEGEHAKYEGFLERHVALEKEHGILRKQHADGAANRLKLNIVSPSSRSPPLQLSVSPREG